MKKLIALTIATLIASTSVAFAAEKIIPGKRMVRVKKDNYQGVDFIDIREVFKGNRDGKLISTKKGVAIKPDQVDDLIAALQEL